MSPKICFHVTTCFSSRCKIRQGKRSESVFRICQIRQGLYVRTGAVENPHFLAMEAERRCYLFGALRRRART